MKKIKDFVPTKEDRNVINVSQNFDEDTICSDEMEPNLSKRMHFEPSSATLHRLMVVMNRHTALPHHTTPLRIASHRTILYIIFKVGKSHVMERIAF